MGTIKLDHSAVVEQLEKVKTALNNIVLPEPSVESLGQNELDYTTKWKEREANIHKNILQYIEVVTKNIEDTRANVDLLKEQDEAIVNK
ncbi:hypothetical protein F9802_14585 [Bacillus aerolatus]|uniref:YwqI/YxiC family protein n=1 Tax=Bacillus aerolatus TaxID=2653354 RepID=A0A6I1FCW8_9BACI|nr:YwqI/YxiC family protein [Bacillus aerolatus]KAB7705325.1 hypothetical protein F9802_14585 [Bacillus aerolatus]